MKFKLRKRLDDDTDYYDRDPIVKYADYLEEKGRIVRVGNLRFDAEAMMTPFVCDTRLCIPSPGAKNGSRVRKTCSCCVAYTPRLSTKERGRLEKILPGMRQRFPRLDKTIEKNEGFYEWDDEYDRMVTTGKGNRCVFLTPDTKEFGFHACTIHAYCLENGLPESLYKPSACVMFPLYLLDLDDEDTTLISIHTREVATLGEDDDFDYVEPGCLKRNGVSRRPLYVEMKDTLVHMFGAEAWRRLDRSLKKWAVGSRQWAEGRRMKDGD